MDRGKLIFVSGGARSGKSRFAEKIAHESGKKVVYIATAQAGDQEMKARITKHKERRPKNWVTIEEPINVRALIDKMGSKDNIILVDCLTLLTSNLLLLNREKIGNEEYEKEILNELEKMSISAVQVPSTVIIVSNEVGMGLVPDKSLGRFYRDILGKANNILAQKADEVFFMVSGIPLKIKG